MRWVLVLSLAVVGCDKAAGVSTTDAAVDARISSCLTEPTNNSAGGCVDQGLVGVDLSGTWHVSGTQYSYVAPSRGAMSFDLTFAPGEGRCLVATSSQDPGVTAYWPDPAGSWLVDTSAAYGGQGHGYHVQATICVSAMTSKMTLTASSWETGTTGHEPLEGRERFEGTLCR